MPKTTPTVPRYWTINLPLELRKPTKILSATVDLPLWVIVQDALIAYLQKEGAYSS